MCMCGFFVLTGEEGHKIERVRGREDLGGIRGEENMIKIDSAWEWDTSLAHTFWKGDWEEQ